MFALDNRRFVERRVPQIDARILALNKGFKLEIPFGLQDVVDQFLKIDARKTAEVVCGHRDLRSVVWRCGLHLQGKMHPITSISGESCRCRKSLRRPLWADSGRRKWPLGTIIPRRQGHEEWQPTARPNCIEREVALGRLSQFSEPPPRQPSTGRPSCPSPLRAAWYPGLPPQRRPLARTHDF